MRTRGLSAASRSRAPATGAARIEVSCADSAVAVSLQQLVARRARPLRRTNAGTARAARRRSVNLTGNDARDADPRGTRRARARTSRTRRAETRVCASCTLRERGARRRAMIEERVVEIEQHDTRGRTRRHPHHYKDGLHGRLTNDVCAGGDHRGVEPDALALRAVWPTEGELLTFADTEPIQALQTILEQQSAAHRARAAVRRHAARRRADQSHQNRSAGLAGGDPRDVAHGRLHARGLARRRHRDRACRRNRGRAATAEHGGRNRRA